MQERLSTGLDKAMRSLSRTGVKAIQERRKYENGGNDEYKNMEQKNNK